MQTKTVDQAANEAVFVMQMNSRSAIGYIINKAGVSYEVAEKALNSAVTFHKKPRCEAVSA